MTSARLDRSWWLATLGRTLHWARLEEREAGTAEVLDHDGSYHAYDSLDTARSMLMDAGYVQFDGLDEDDALERGFSLDEVAPPRAGSDAELVGLMSVSLGKQA
ncbi:hypothetical protein B1992_13815 [Pseudoxanthomonas broegbernensis]|uniref:Uncharacterized protein n=1 Tax=Pseudoxanthomonas broegbernensis TaxID=83619 RepID=A0A7V8K6E9_9GAMM|nr:hypothetical protein [Pseudoxanthomonas broegbernensis]KAF1684991.1 hypothetical protein B1992_13815 [Pseudoxanthomonas broegbernensis]MBB6064820.1 hypothetical protein [Pseudoxanthomonas broegbernensis]